MSNIVLGALLENLFEAPSYPESARTRARIAGHLARAVLWVAAIVIYGIAIGFLQQDTLLAKVGLVLVGLSMLPALAFVLFLGPEWARSSVLQRSKAKRR